MQVLNHKAGRHERPPGCKDCNMECSIPSGSSAGRKVPLIVTRVTCHERPHAQVR
jgi:hypothetical protein